MTGYGIIFGFNRSFQFGSINWRDIVAVAVPVTIILPDCSDCSDVRRDVQNGDISI